MHYKKEKIGLFIVLIWFIAFFCMTFSMREEVRVWPQFVEGMGIILTIIYLGTVIYKEKNQIKLDSPAPLDKELLKIVIESFAFFILYVVVAKRVGFIVTTFIFCNLFTYWQFKGDKKYKYILISFIFSGVIFLIFDLLLGIPLPRGFLI